MKSTALATLGFEKTAAPLPGVGALHRVGGRVADSVESSLDDVLETLIARYGPKAEDAAYRMADQVGDRIMGQMRHAGQEGRELAGEAVEEAIQRYRGPAAKAGLLAALGLTGSVAGGTALGNAITG